MNKELEINYAFILLKTYLTEYFVKDIEDKDVLIGQAEKLLNMGELSRSDELRVNRLKNLYTKFEIYDFGLIDDTKDDRVSEGIVADFDIRENINSILTTQNMLKRINSDW